MFRRVIFVLMLAGFGIGILARSFFAIDWGFAALLGIISIFFFVFSRIYKGSVFLFLGIALLSLSLGILRYETKDRADIPLELKNVMGESIFLRGTIVEEPDERENSTRLIFQAHEMLNWQERQWQNISSVKLLLITRRLPEFSYGDTLEIRGVVKEPENFSDFDYRAYLAKDDIFLEMVFPAITKTGSGEGWRLKRMLFAVKRKYLESLSRALPEPQASFLGGLTVGAKRSMPPEVLEDFRKVGVIHIVVLSGYNVTIVARSIAGFFAGFLPYALSVSAGLVGIFLFAILTGASATVVRASIMAAILYFAGLTGRVYQAKIALFVAGFLMLLANPKILRFDVSFQLSFLATLGLLYLSPHLERFVRFLPKKFQIREYGLATLSAQLAVTPLLLYTMGTFSVVALPANLLILIFVPLTMLFGFLTGVIGWVSGILAMPFAWITYLFASYELAVADILAKPFFSEITISHFPAVAAFFLYGLLAYFVLRKRNS
ncbi:ComEC family competence protein [Patescibacteria group bacterium]|nr:ComEC family competence protein [Patescibacteria group bacterium]